MPFVGRSTSGVKKPIALVKRQNIKHKREANSNQYVT